MEPDLTALAVLAVDLRAVVSHGSAGQVWRSAGMRLASEPELATLTVERNRSRVSREDVILHRRDLAPDEVCVRFGVPITSPLQTTIDLARG